MRAIQIHEQGGPEVLGVTELPDPTPGPGEVVVRVAAAGVNYIDTYHRSGAYPMPTPFVPGLEGAGAIVAVGDGVTDLAVGDRVAWKDAIGSYAELVVVPTAAAIPITSAVEDDAAAALLLQGMTAHYLATDTFPIGAGDWALVHAAAGGVGLLLTQIVKIRGGRVLATVGTAEKAELATGAGAERVVVTGGGDGRDIVDAAREVTDGAGVAVVYDGIGRDTFNTSLDCLRRRGLMVLYGASSGPAPALDLQTLNAKGSLYATRPTLGDYTPDRASLLARAEELFGWVAEGRLDVRIGHRYPLAEAAQAHEDLQARRTTGKVLLIP